MRHILPIIFLVYSSLTFAQENQSGKGTSKESLGAAKKNIYNPSIILGQITSNPTTNNFGLDLTEQSINLKGIFFQSKRGIFIAGANVIGNNENSSLGIFSSGNLNAKLTGDLSLTFTFPARVRYTTINRGLVDDNDGYEEILEKTDVYNANRQRFKFLTAGVEGAGAKYYLIDSTAQFDNMVQERKFTGWKFYGQLNIIDFHIRNKKNKIQNLALIHSGRISYGEVNNTSDLTEHTISNSTSFTNGNNTQKFGRSVTGYFDTYFVQHQAVLSYEFNLYDMDTTSLKAGFIAGADFVYNSKQKNFIRFNAGLNFPVAFTRSGKKVRRLYIGAIVSTTDPMNARKNEDFSIVDTFSASLRLVSPIRINIKSE